MVKPQPDQDAPLPLGPAGAKKLDRDYRAQTGGRLTTAGGVRLPDTDHSLKAGERGPDPARGLPLPGEDHPLRPRAHPRAGRARARGGRTWRRSEANGAAAGLTRAGFLQDGAETEVFARFSTVVGSRGSADTARDVRGFAVKFYTSEGNFDLVGNNMPVFFIQDAIKFPDLIHAVKPHPDREIPQAQSAHDTFWDFASLHTESTHMLMWLMSDRAIPRSYRTMEGFGVHTFRLVNSDGESVAGEVPLEAGGRRALAGLGGGPDRGRCRSGLPSSRPGRRDRGRSPPEWDLGLQVFEDNDDQTFEGIDLLDPTKIVPEELAPVQVVGTMTLTANPTNYFAETEQVAFHTGHLVPGIEATRRPADAGPDVLLPRHPAEPARWTELHPAPDQPAACAGQRHAARRHAPDSRSPGHSAVPAELARRRGTARGVERKRARTSTGRAPRRREGPARNRSRSRTTTARRPCSGRA